MINQTIIDYIKENQEKGFSTEDLKNQLINSGYQEQDIDDSINNINSPQNENKQTPSEEKQNTDQKRGKIKKRNPFVILLLTIITLGIYSLFWTVFTTNELRRNTSSAPNPWLLLLFIIPFVGIYYYWKYSKALKELTGEANNILIFILWIIFAPVAMVLSQIELNKKAN